MEKKVAKEEIDKILRQYMLASAGVGMIPLPVADVAGLIGVQITMLKKLAELYDVPFLKEAVKKVLSSLVGGILLTNACPLIASTVKYIPIIGQAVGAVTMPALCGAATYATGKVFVQHFESGGTFLTFDPEKVRNYYAEMFEQGKTVAAKIKDSKE
ncbi:MAG: DUF697 domain-containing protein [Desulfobacteraceae bacterium]|nr:DUF697 domain-containing protein [Desulfobacteraceae bacterium]